MQGGTGDCPEPRAEHNGGRPPAAAARARAHTRTGPTAEQTAMPRRTPRRAERVTVQGPGREPTKDKVPHRGAWQPLAFVKTAPFFVFEGGRRLALEYFEGGAFKFSFKGSTHREAEVARSKALLRVLLGIAAGLKRDSGERRGFEVFARGTSMVIARDACRFLLPVCPPRPPSSARDCGTGSGCPSG